MAEVNTRYQTYLKQLLDNRLVKGGLKSRVVRSYSPYIFSLITVIVLTIFAIRPTISTILNLQKELQNHRQTLQALKDKGTNLTTAQRNLDAISEADKTKIEAAIPKQAEVISLIQNLKAILPPQASASAIQVQPVTLNATANDKLHPELGAISFTFNVEGSFSQFLQLLTAMRQSPRALTVDNINISKASEGVTVISINAKSYFLK